jgi:hypothetical protein
LAPPRREGREAWPRGLRERRPGYYSYVYQDGTERGMGRYPSEAEAIAAAAALMDRFNSAATFAAAAATDKRLHLMKWSAYYRATARSKASQHALMSRDDYEVLWLRSGGKCELTGITFSTRPDGNTEAVWPWGASIDRLDNARGYELDNCRLVCIAMNLALHQFGEEVFEVLAKCYSITKGARRGRPSNPIGDPATGR